MALSVVVAELVELFQWKSEDESQRARDDLAAQQATADEIADVAIYLTQLVDALLVDINTAVTQKLEKNAKKHPLSGGATADG
jgi:NTP pyrophosphatase (non-canonical NTP hydrolase)